MDGVQVIAVVECSANPFYRVAGHRWATGGLRAGQQLPLKPIHVLSRISSHEVGDEAQGIGQLGHSAQLLIIQVDKLGPEDLAALVKAVRAVAPQAAVAAAGGINLDNVKAYAATGVDLLVTSAMYWGKPADIGVAMEATV